MSKGYVIFTEKISDSDALAAYSAAAVPSVIAAGGPAIKPSSLNDTRPQPATS